jgi:FkbM family methyltransferase
VKADELAQLERLTEAKERQREALRANQPASPIVQRPHPAPHPGHEDERSQLARLEAGKANGRDAALVSRGMPDPQLQRLDELRRRTRERFATKETCYSQFEEQTYILNLLAGQTGRFLDIGAFHPTIFSNTRALFELGWAGVMIEPSPGPMRTLLKEYGNEPRIILIQAALAEEPGLIEMHVTDDAVSTSEDLHYEVWQEQGGFVGSMLAPTVTLAQLSNQFGAFEMVSMDVEGKSGRLALDAIALGWRPRLWCIEKDGLRDELLSATLKLGYRLRYENGTNMIVARAAPF